jgi:5-enolpyruvylshikimate-3-phosphate synthase
MTSIECRPGGPVAGTIRVPGDKSISHPQSVSVDGCVNRT